MERSVFRLRLTSAVAAFAAIITVSVLARSLFAAPVAPGTKDWPRIAELQRIGLNKEIGKTSILLASLHDSRSTPVEKSVVLRALTRLDARETVPDIERLLRNRSTYDPTLKNFAQTVRARLVAEDSTPTTLAPADQARRKMQRFLGELKLNVYQLNNTGAAQKQEDASGSHPITLLGTHALRELADMIYEGDTDLAAEARRQGLRFGRFGVTPGEQEGDQAAALKVQIAPLSRADRIAFLVGNLSWVVNLTSDTRYAMQLAINEGKPASAVALRRLSEMQTDRRRSSPEAFAALLRVVTGGGDAAGLPLIATFLGDKRLAPYARQAHRELASGSPKPAVAGY